MRIRDEQPILPVAVAGFSIEILQPPCLYKASQARQGSMQVAADIR